jgi:hypothetical protein
VEDAKAQVFDSPAKANAKINKAFRRRSPRRAEWRAGWNAESGRKSAGRTGGLRENSMGSMGSMGGERRAWRESPLGRENRRGRAPDREGRVWRFISIVMPPTKG